jgi:hypothetical protein
MKHYIIVLSIILFVSLTFFYPSIIEDASFNDYNYLRDIRRSNNTIDNDYTKQKLYENTTFNTQGSGITGTSSGNSSSSSSVGISPIVYSNITPTVKQPEQKIDNSTESKSSTNLLPYLLLLLLLMVVIIVYVKYKMN